MKDLLATRGMPTGWGAEPYRDQVFDYDATVVRRLREAGAVLVAKLAMVELAGGMGYNHANASFTGPGLTPWNTTFWSGGSSSGPGAAVAAGLVPFAIGSETSGSILTPSAFCGVTGLRPTYGLVSRHGAMALCWTLDKLGPMGRTADDCALVLAAMAGADPLDESASIAASSTTAPALRAGGRRLRLAVPKGVTEKVQPAVRENFEAALRALGSDVEVTRDVEWPDFPWGPAVGDDRGRGGRGRVPRPDRIGRGAAKLKCPADRWGGYSALLLPAVDYLQAMRLRRPMKQAVARAVRAVRRGRGADARQRGVPGRPQVRGRLAGRQRRAGADRGRKPVRAARARLPNGFGENGLPTSIPAHGAGVLRGAAGARSATPTSSAPTGRRGGHPRSEPPGSVTARRSPAVPQRLDRAAHRRQHLGARAAQPQRCADPHLAEEGHREELALRQRAPQVRQVGRHNGHTGELLGEVGDPRLEGRHLRSAPARALGEEQEGLATLERPAHPLDRVVLAVDRGPAMGSTLKSVRERNERARVRSK